MAAQDLVILLHGILRSRTDMLPLSLSLKRKGYTALNILYPSRKKSLEELTEFVRERVEAHPQYKDFRNIHFVTHSMGGLIARYYIATHRQQNLGKVVMLAPPNTGSEFADMLSEHPFLAPLYAKLFGPAGGQLKTTYAHTGAIDYPLGVIAGNVSINPLAIGVLPGRHDGIVPVERTRIEGMTDHIVLPVTHTFMMFNPRVMAQTRHFLENGRFQPLSARLQKRASSVE